jgi:hypothetical protein
VTRNETRGNKKRDLANDKCEVSNTNEDISRKKMKTELKHDKRETRTRNKVGKINETVFSAHYSLRGDGKHVYNGRGYCWGCLGMCEGKD